MTITQLYPQTQAPGHSQMITELVTGLLRDLLLIKSMKQMEKATTVQHRQKIAAQRMAALQQLNGEEVQLVLTQIAKIATSGKPLMDANRLVLDAIVGYLRTRGLENLLKPERSAAFMMSLLEILIQPDADVLRRQEEERLAEEERRRIAAEEAQRAAMIENVLERLRPSYKSEVDNHPVIIGTFEAAVTDLVRRYYEGEVTSEHIVCRITMLTSQLLCQLDINDLGTMEEAADAAEQLFSVIEERDEKDATPAPPVIE